MKKTIGILSAVLMLGSMPAFAAAPNGQAAELGLHRIERLVILKKIEATFQTRSESITVVKLVQPLPTDPYFKVSVSQGAAADGTKKTVDLMMDQDGKTLSFSVNAASDPKNPATWPDKDAISLLEPAFHCIEGELIDTSRACADSADVQAFNKDFSQAQLTQIKDGQGKPIGAVVEVKSSGLKTTLKIYFNLDGTLDANKPFEILAFLDSIE